MRVCKKKNKKTIHKKHTHTDENTRYNGIRKNIMNVKQTQHTHTKPNTHMQQKKPDGFFNCC